MEIKEMPVIMWRPKKGDSVEVRADSRIGTVRSVSEINGLIRVEVKMTDAHAKSAGKALDLDLPREWFDSDELALI